jgi:hypothetical protein
MARRLDKFYDVVSQSAGPIVPRHTTRNYRFEVDGMTILIVTSRGITSCFDGTTNKQFSETVAFPTDNGDYLDARAELTLHKTPSITLSIVAITFNSLLMNETWQKIIRANRSIKIGTHF